MTFAQQGNKKRHEKSQYCRSKRLMKQEAKAI
jgi:hypothetical protein